MSKQLYVRTVSLYYKISMSNNYIVKSYFFNRVNNSINTGIGHNLSYLRYKFNYSIFEFYNEHNEILYQNIFNADTANLNVIIYTYFVGTRLINSIIVNRWLTFAKTFRLDRATQREAGTGSL